MNRRRRKIARTPRPRHLPHLLRARAPGQAFCQLIQHCMPLIFHQVNISMIYDSSIIQYFIASYSTRFHDTPLHVDSMSIHLSSSSFRRVRQKITPLMEALLSHASQLTLQSATGSSSSSVLMSRFGDLRSTFGDIRA